MRGCVVVSIFVLAGSFSLHCNAVTPVEKVIQLLNGMLEKGKQEKHEETVTFAAFSQFCEDTQAETESNIAKEKDEVERLTADIAKDEADAKTLSSAISALNAEISKWTEEKNGAIADRQEQHESYTKTHTDYSESVSALKRAIDVLKKQNYDRKQAAELLLQIQMSGFVPPSDRRQIQSLLQDDGAPDVNAYEFQSGGIIGVLEKLHSKFKEELHVLEKEESNSKHAHQMYVQDISGQITGAEENAADKTGARASHLQSAADSKKTKGETEAELEEDSSYLIKLVATCKQKHADFENRQTLRAEEIAALEEAIKIMSGDNVSGSADKHLPSFLQLRRSSVRRSQDDDASRAMAYLQAQSDKLGSIPISALVLSASVGGPFDKIKKMINDLMVRLMEEAAEEAQDHKGCQKDLSVNKKRRNKRKTNVIKLTAETDQLDAKIAKTTEKIDELSEEVKVLQSERAKATETRVKEKKQNETTIAEAKDAQDAVAKALEVLKNFYEKAGRATSLIQDNPEIPEVMSKPYKGQQAESGGVLGMLEVILSDFNRLQTETEAEEEAAEAQYQSFLKENKIDVAKKNAAIEQAETTRKRDELRLQEATGELQDQKDDLDLANKVHDSLKTRCVDSGVSHEERVQKRKEEIQSLQEALKILSGEDLA